jgi:hypothetical protein
MEIDEKDLYKKEENKYNYKGTIFTNQNKFYFILILLIVDFILIYPKFEINT